MRKRLKLVPTTDRTIHIEASAVAFPVAPDGYDVQCGTCEETMLEGYDPATNNLIEIDSLVCQHCGNNNLFASVFPQG
jgi:hypothetical protein